MYNVFAMVGFVLTKLKMVPLQLSLLITRLHRLVREILVKMRFFPTWRKKQKNVDEENDCHASEFFLLSIWTEKNVTY